VENCILPKYIQALSVVISQTLQYNDYSHSIHMAAHAFTSSTWKAEAGRQCEFEASLVYITLTSN
ncbi:hypothetical protein ACQP3C_29920, partial [Escherichia coli]